MNKRRFVIVALVLSAAWYPVLLAIPHHGQFIRENTLNPHKAGLAPYEFIFILCAAGLFVGWVFRHRIISSSGWMSVLLGCILTYVSAAIFLVFLSAYISIRTWYFKDFLVYIFWGMLATFLWLPVVAPVGIVMQFTLRWAAQPNKSFNRTRN